MAYLIKVYSPKETTVLDPFCGSGSTGVAALQENRKFVGIDLSSHYVDISTKRCADWELAHNISNPLADLL